MFERLNRRLLKYAENDGRGFPDWASRYVPVLNRLSHLDLARSAILEIGANENGFARFTKARTVAVDLDIDHLKACRDSQEALPVVADITALPFKPNTFDLCICMDTFEHIPSETRAAACHQIARVLEPSGAAMIAFPSGSAASKAEAGIRQSYEKHTGQKLNWLEEHAQAGLPDADTVVDMLATEFGESHRVTATGNVPVWLWKLMWRILMCGWPGRGNAVFQALLRLATPLLNRPGTDKECYRTMLWVEPEKASAGHEARQSPLLSIVIPTFNGKDLLLECLDSVAAQRLENLEVIVVDDASTDGTYEMLHQTHTHVRRVRLAINKGFAAAVNEGIQRARGDYIMLLNNDMTLAQDCLANLMEAADDDVMLAPLVLWRDQPELIYGAGDRLLANGRPESIGHRASLKDFVVEEEVFGVSAGAAIYPRGMFQEIGLMDEKYIAYFEDVDLCFRARLAGYRSMVIADSVTYHVGSASIQTKMWWRTQQCFRNHVILVLKNMPLQLLLVNSPGILLEHILGALRLFSAARCEYGAAKATLIVVSAKLSICRLIPHALLSRIHIQRNRKARMIAQDGAIVTREKQKRD